MSIEPEISAAVSPSVATGETVLLVEDEPAVRNAVRRYLHRLGYVVIEAEHGADALAVSSAHEGKVALVMTDVVMPSMGGGELVRRLREGRPEIKALFMSGYGGAAATTIGNLPPDAHFLQKPFAATSLATAVRAAIDGST